VQPRDYGLWAEQLVNSAAGDVDAIGTVAGLREFLASLDQPPGRVSAADVTATNRLREELAAVFHAGDGEARVAMVRAAVATLDVRFEVTEHDGTPHLHLARAGAGAATFLRTAAYFGLAALLAEGFADRLGVCAAPGCERVFIDTSRNGMRRFCGPTHAARVNVREHRRRRQAGAT
jgi:predicted RNA-binding Zn ribbon-like protein